jgi:hypothetical protein
MLFWILGGFLVAFLLSSFTFFLGTYALLIRWSLTRPLYDFLKLLLASGIAVLGGLVASVFVLAFFYFFLCIFPALMFVSIRFLCTPTLITLAKPRNKILLLRMQFFKSSSPLVFSALLLLVNLAVIFILSAWFFPH